MEEFFNEIVQNAQNGEEPCAGCPAQQVAEGEHVKPGLSNPDGELVFVTEEPRHPTDWSKYDSWEEYNEERMQRFANARGGKFINRLLSKTKYRLEDVWVTDSIKCPTKRDEGRKIPAADTEECFDHCGTYLESEIRSIDPDAVVTLGRRATTRTLRALGVPTIQAESVRVTRDYGYANLDTDYPVIISLHWAQRALAEAEWVPVVQEMIAEIVS